MARRRNQSNRDKSESTLNIGGHANVGTAIGKVQTLIAKIYLPNSIVLLISLVLIIVAVGIYFYLVNRPQWVFEPAQEGETLVILAPFSGGSTDAVFNPMRLLREPIQVRMERMQMTQDDKLRLEEWTEPISTAHGARNLGNEYGATLVIWGEFDDVIGVRTFVEITKDVPAPDAQQEGTLLPLASLEASIDQSTEIGRVTQDCLTNDLPQQGDYLTTLSMGILQLARHNFSAAPEFFTQSLDAAKRTENGTCAISPQQAYYWRGLSYSLLSNYPAALADFDQALALQPDYLLAFAQRGNANIAMGNPVAAQQDYSAALNLLYPEDRRSRAALLGNIGLTYELMKQYDQAEAYYQQALELDKVDGQPEALALDWLHLGSLAIRQNKQAIGEQYLAAALKNYKEADDIRGQAIVIGNLGLVKYNQGDYAGAKQSFDESLDLYDQLGDPNGMATQLVRIGKVYLAQNNADQAQANFEQALALNESSGSIYGQAMAYLGLGTTAYQRQDIPETLTNLQKAFDLLDSINSPDAEMVKKVLDQVP